MSGPAAPRLAAPVSYDRVPYPDLSYSQTHPDRLATVATLLGLQPVPPQRCRVLELGCAVGGNVLPMAYGLPASQFVGIDRSAHQVAEGQATAARLGLANVKLRAMDILDVDRELGLFDYIIAHGVYSWVAPEVRDKLLEVCRQNLAPGGLAYVSYNTYPGWHMIQIVRDAMLYRTRGVAEPEARAARARAVLDLLAEAHTAGDDAYGSFLRMYVQVLRDKEQDTGTQGDALLLHDELEEHNEPVYFHQFADHAAQHGLQYLGEAEFSAMTGSRLAPAVTEQLGRIVASVIDVEQYLDFIQNRTFRQTLLCHQDTVASRTLRPDVVLGLRVASRARLANESGAEETPVAHFKGHDGAVLAIDHPVTRAALLCLADIWPRSMPFEDLLTAARRRLTGQHVGSAAGRQTAGEDVDAEVLATNLLTAVSYSDSLAELHVHSPAFAWRASERPIASPVARLQASASRRVTNLLHQRVRLDELDRFLLPRLDGSRDRSTLSGELLAGPVAAGVLTLTGMEQGIGDVKTLAKEVDKRLSWLARAALLIA